MKSNNKLLYIISYLYKNHADLKFYETSPTLLLTDACKSPTEPSKQTLFEANDNKPPKTSSKVYLYINVIIVHFPEKNRP